MRQKQRNSLAGAVQTGSVRALLAPPSSGPPRRYKDRPSHLSLLGDLPLFYFWLLIVRLGTSPAGDPKIHLAWLMGKCELCKDGDKWDACYGIGNDSGNKAMVSCCF